MAEALEALKLGAGLAIGALTIWGIVLINLAPREGSPQQVPQAARARKHSVHTKRLRATERRYVKRKSFHHQRHPITRRNVA